MEKSDFNEEISNFKPSCGYSSDIVSLEADVDKHRWVVLVVADRRMRPPLASILSNSERDCVFRFLYIDCRFVLLKDIVIYS